MIRVARYWDLYILRLLCLCLLRQSKYNVIPLENRAQEYFVALCASHCCNTRRALYWSAFSWTAFFCLQEIARIKRRSKCYCFVVRRSWVQILVLITAILKSVVINLSLCMQILGSCLKAGHNCFLPCNFQCINKTKMTAPQLGCRLDHRTLRVPGMNKGIPFRSQIPHRFWVPSSPLWLLRVWAAGHSFPSCAEATNAWSYVWTPAYVFVARLITYRTNFTFYRFIWR
jgi:hypothetical protein